MKLNLTLAPAFVFGALLCSCGSKDKPEEKKPEEAKKESHDPSDWTPEGPDLVKGKAIYKQECSGCHDEGEEGAPPLLDVAQWEKRTSQGLEKLIDNAINGFTGPDGVMPARGGTDSLTDEEVANAVKFMVNTPR